MTFSRIRIECVLFLLITAFVSHFCTKKNVIYYKNAFRNSTSTISFYFFFEVQLCKCELIFFRYFTSIIIDSKNLFNLHKITKRFCFNNVFLFYYVDFHFCNNINVWIRFQIKRHKSQCFFFQQRDFSCEFQ